MSSPWWDRWNRKRFAQLLEPGGDGPRRHRRATRDDELAAMVTLTRELPEAGLTAAPDPEFRGSLRAFLMATAEREGIGATAVTDAVTETAAPNDALAGKTQPVRQVRPSATPARARLALLVGATVGALVLSGVSLASTDSLPGDALYQIKISAERAQLAMAGSDLSRGQLYLEFAASRLAEAARVDSGQLAAALAEMDRQTREGATLLLAAAENGDAGALRTLSAFLVHQREGLLALSEHSDRARATVAQSLTLLDQLEAQLDQLAIS